jgi:hypothetical protein
MWQLRPDVPASHRQFGAEEWNVPVAADPASLARERARAVAARNNRRHFADYGFD